MAYLLVFTSVVGVLLLLLMLITLPKAIYNYYIRCKTVRNLPGLPTHWLWGNLHQLTLNESMSEKWTELIHQGRYKLTRTWLGPFLPMVAVQHCSLVGRVLKETKDKDNYGLIKPWLGDGLLISSGKKWFRHRRLLTPAFHYEILKQYVSVYTDCTKFLMNKWALSCKKNEPVKLFDTISLLSLDVIMQCAFSFQSNCQDATQSHPYIQRVRELVELSANRFVRLLYRVDWIYYLTAEGKRFRKACKLAHEHSEMVIQERKKFLGLNTGGPRLKREAVLDKASRNKKHLDFLDILLTAEDENGEGLTDLEVRDEVDTFMFEGHDTTTSGMCWTLYCLAKHPEHQDKVREEVRNVLMGRDWLEYDDLKELKYTQWCIKEAMRLYPPVFFVLRSSEGNLNLDGHAIPKGIAVGLSIRQIHRHPDTWENPNEFDPLRFHPDNVEGRHPFAYIPFSGGQRNCIGQNFALNEERVVIASILNRFKLSLVEGHKVETVPKIVLRSKNDIKVHLEPCF